MAIYINARFLTQKVTGVQRFSTEICKELVKIRDDIIFLVPDKSSIIDNSLLDIFNIVELKGGYGHFWEQVTLPFFLCKKNNPLLVNLCNSAPVLYFNKISSLHDIIFIKYPKSFSFMFNFIYRIITPLILMTSKKIITVSEFSKKDISKTYSLKEDKIHVIYNAVSEDFFNKNKKKQVDKYCLAVSSLNYHKNFNFLIEAFMEVETSLKLIIVGENNPVFNRLNNNNNNNNNIEFYGRCSDKELIQLYQNAEFFIFPSLYEGFGIPPLEAQACGCPVIASNAASIPEILCESAIYFDPACKEQFKHTLYLIEHDSNLRQTLTEFGYKNVKRFSWKNSSIQLNKFIDEVV